MDTFTATNGSTVTRSNGQIVLRVNPEAWGHALEAWEEPALREFFQAEADERLGRWRWPENPDYVVYPRAYHVAVVNEQSGNALQATRNQAEINTGLCRAARAYFDAHPEPKPWHDAIEGDFWAVTFESQDTRVCRAVKPLYSEVELAFQPVDQAGGTWYAATSPYIVGATRIWQPEVSS